MKCAAAAVALLGLGVAGLQFSVLAQGIVPVSQAPRGVAPASAARSVWDGVYTVAQARRGAVHAEECATCHGPDMEGDVAPTLVGAGFTSKWNGKPLDGLFQLTANELKRLAITSNRPNVDLETPLAQQAADFVAYLLLQNRFPAGTTDLPIGLESLSQIRIRASKP